MKNEPVTVEHIYNARIEKVWEAITSKDAMKILKQNLVLSLVSTHPIKE